MKTIDELQQLFNTELKGNLQSLEKLRKSVSTTYTWTGLLALAAIGLIIALPNATGISIGMAMIVVVIIASVKTSPKMKKYRKVFKETIVKELLRMIDPGWHYDYQSCISSKEYWDSNLFHHFVDRYHGDDLVTGRIGKTDFRFSELHTQYKTVTTDSNGHRREQWHTIFRGLFMHADFNKSIKGKTYVLPDRAERLFGKFGQKFQKDKSRGELIKLENPEFEKLFKVYGSDQIEARYVMTPKMMERMVDMRNKYKTNLHFSFIGQRVYCALSLNKSLFEPRIFSSGVRFEDISGMYDLFNLIDTIISELELNTRIWSKA